MTKSQVFKRATILNLAVTGAIAILGSVGGFLAASSAGVFGALLGAGIAAAFGLFTLGSIALGGKLSLGGFYGAVLGGWLVKVLLFAVFIAALRSAEWMHGPTFFFALVAAVLGNLAVDSWVVLTGRIETVQS